MQKVISKFCPYIFIIFLTLFLYRGVILIPSDKIIYGSDINDQFYFWKSFYVNSIRNGIIPFWNPYSFSGTPFLAHPSVAPFYPLNLIFFLFPFNLSFSLFIFIHIVIACAGTYRFCRKNHDFLSSLLGGIVFAFSGLFASRIYAGHLEIIATLSWIPFVFHSVTSTLTKGDKKTFFGAILFLTIQILAGYQFVVVITLELILIFIVAKFISSPHQFSYKNCIKLFFIILGAYGLSAVQILPTIEFVSHSIRGSGLPFDLASWGSYTLDAFKLFINPYVYGNPFPANYTYSGPGPNFFELNYYVGMTPLLVILFYSIIQAVVYLKTKKIDKQFIFYLIAVIFFSLIALGRNSVLYRWLFNFIGPYRIFRFPAQHLMMSVFLLSLAFSRAVSPVKSIFKVIILFLVTVELLSFSYRYITVSPIPTVSFDKNLINQLRGDSQNYRFMPDFTVVSPVRSIFDFEAASFYQLPSTSGYNPIILENYYHFIDLINKSKQSSIPYFNVEIPPPDLSTQLLNYLNVKYILEDSNYDTLEKSQLKNYQIIIKDKKYHLYENLNPLPRFFLVDKVEVFDTKQRLEEKLLTSDIDLSKTVLLTKKDLEIDFKPLNQDCDNKDSDTRIIDYSINSIKLKIKNNCDSFLSSSEVYYPGWKAKIDGKSTDIYLANTAFRALFVSGGEHIIEFYYFPLSYYLGGGITLLTLLFLVIYYRKK